MDTLCVKSVSQVAHFIEDAAESPHITFVGVILGLEKLRTHVIGCSNARISKVFSTVEHLCYAKISKSDL